MEEEENIFGGKPAYTFNNAWNSIWGIWVRAERASAAEPLLLVKITTHVYARCWEDYLGSHRENKQPQKIFEGF